MSDLQRGMPTEHPTATEAAAPRPGGLRELLDHLRIRPPGEWEDVRNILLLQNRILLDIVEGNAVLDSDLQLLGQKVDQMSARSDALAAAVKSLQDAVAAIPPSTTPDVTDAQIDDAITALDAVATSLKALAPQPAPAA